MIPYAKLAALVAAVALGVALCFFVYARPAIAQRDVTIATMKAADEAATISFKLAAQQKDQENATKLATANDQLATANASVVRYRSDVAGLSNGLRDIVTRYASSNPGGLPSAPAATCPVDDRPQVLGRLLNESLGVLAEGGGNALQAAATIRAFQTLQGPVK